MHARVCDPAGPRWWRASTFVLGGTLVVLGMALAIAGAGPDASAWLATALVGVAVLVGGRPLLPRLRSRDVELRLGRGWLEIRRAGLLRQRIHARDAIAASTAQTWDGVALAIVHRSRPGRPILVHVSHEQDLDGVRRALGLGHLGFGAIAWPAGGSGVDVAIGAVSFIAALGWLTAAVCVAIPILQPLFVIPLLTAPLTLCGLVLALSWNDSRPRVLLTGAGVAGPGWLIPYAEVTRVETMQRALAIETGRGRQVIAMPAALDRELAHLAAQIQSARHRCLGYGRPPPSVSGGLSALVPRGESTRAWLDRIDATASALGPAATYRRAGVEVGELWEALESADAPAGIRAAAARILARVAPVEAKARIAGALAIERHPDTRERIRLALEQDASLAASELEALDARAAQSGYAPHS
jgi:hypothetical protein